MSHVVTIDVQVKNLEALKAAAAECGLEFREGQTTYKWYGSWVRDYNAQDAAYRHGVAPERYGKDAAHALGVPNNSNAYEIGVVPLPDASGYTLVWDNWCGGHGLQALIGQNADKLKAAYSKHNLLAAFRQGGFTVTKQKVLADGRLHIQARHV